MFVGKVGDVVKEEDVMEVEEEWIQEAAAFEFEAKVLNYVQSSEIFRRDPRLNRLQHMSFAERAVLFWRFTS